MVLSNQTAAVCAIRDNTVKALAAGTCTIAANQDGGNIYAPALQQTLSFTIGGGAAKRVQAITFGAAPAIVVGGTANISVSGGGSGNPVALTSQTTAVCTLADQAVTGVGAGTCTLAAAQAGNDSYQDALPQTLSFTVTDPVADKTAQAISFGAAPVILAGGSGRVSASGGASGNPVTMVSQTPAVCSLDGEVVTAVGTGLCTIAANQAGNDSYGDAPQTTQSFSINAADLLPQAIVFDASASLAVGATATLRASGGGSGNPLRFASGTPSVCSVDGNTLSGLTAGTCTVTANQSGNDLFSAAPQAEQNLSVTQGLSEQRIVFGAAPKLSVGGSGTVSASGGASGNPVNFASLSNDVCTVSGNTVTAVDAGTCTVAADQAGNDLYYAAAKATLSFSVAGAAAKQDQTITPGDALKIKLGASATLGASGGNSGNALQFASQAPDICTVNGTSVTGVGVGLCPVSVNQDGNASYNSAPQVTQVVEVYSKLTQSITLPAPPPIAVAETAKLFYAAGDSGQAVVLSSLTPAVCSVADGEVTGLAAGQCLLAADQPGDANYEAAPQAKTNLTVTALGVPFSANISAAGLLSEQTLFATITPSSDDAGQHGSIFAGVLVENALLLLSETGWVTITGPDSIVPFYSGALMAREITLVTGANLTPYVGGQIFVGYGRGKTLSDAYQDMMAKKTLVKGYELR